MAQDKEYPPNRLQSNSCLKPVELELEEDMAEDKEHPPQRPDCPLNWFFLYIKHIFGIWD
jgi:hypothetical protein